MSAIQDAIIVIAANIGLIALVVGLLVGLAVIPLIAAITAGQLPSMLSEPLANYAWKVALIANGRTVLHQLPTDEYELRQASDDREPTNYWSRLLGIPFGLSYTRSEEAYRGHAERLAPDALVTDGGAGLPGNREETDVKRGGIKTYLDTTQSAGLFVAVGAKVAELMDSDGLDTVNVAKDETIKDEGGKKGLETKWKAIFWLGMAFLGTATGVGVFFIL